MFVLLHQLQIFSLGRPLPEQPPICPPADLLENSRAKGAGIDVSGPPKSGTELRLGQFFIQHISVVELYSTSSYLLN